MADTKISALTDGHGLAAGDQIPIDRAGTNFRAQPLGMSSLVYRYTVTGSDKASIDTGVDTADAGSNDWTNGDLLEVFLYSRTDEATSSTTTQEPTTISVVSRTVMPQSPAVLARPSR